MPEGMRWPFNNRRWILQAAYEGSRPHSPRRIRNAEVLICLAAASTIPMNQRLLVTVEHSKADRPDPARSHRILDVRFRNTPPEADRPPENHPNQSFERAERPSPV